MALSSKESLMKKSTFGIDERDEEDVEVGEKRKNTEEVQENEDLYEDDVFGVGS
ncbi:hypothetical protein JHK82_052632 [Glycine max]|nr:hypothetical protein JHK86_052480 [Glycine max]KAG4926843.1 hypothetical protein JHK85_053329 [Glycine max]KAG5082480.1 hypothetical protein JHK84_052518 [Glycine max]KAG5085235.1 hypothetical protein JHK82_052632 [Glycine max]